MAAKKTYAQRAKKIMDDFEGLTGKINDDTKEAMLGRLAAEQEVERQQREQAEETRGELEPEATELANGGPTEPVSDKQVAKAKTTAGLSLLTGETAEQAESSMNRQGGKDQYAALARDRKREITGKADDQLNKYEMDAMIKSFYENNPGDDHTIDIKMPGESYIPVSKSGMRQNIIQGKRVDSMAKYGDITTKEQWKAEGGPVNKFYEGGEGDPLGDADKSRAMESSLPEFEDIFSEGFDPITGKATNGVGYNIDSEFEGSTDHYLPGGIEDVQIEGFDPITGKPTNGTGYTMADDGYAEGQGPGDKDPSKFSQYMDKYGTRDNLGNAMKVGAVAGSYINGLNREAPEQLENEQIDSAVEAKTVDRGRMDNMLDQEAAGTRYAINNSGADNWQDLAKMHSANSVKTQQAKTAGHAQADITDNASLLAEQQSDNVMNLAQRKGDNIINQWNSKSTEDFKDYDDTNSNNFMTSVGNMGTELLNRDDADSIVDSTNKQVEAQGALGKMANQKSNITTPTPEVTKLDDQGKVIKAEGGPIGPAKQEQDLYSLIKKTLNTQYGSK